MADLGSKNCVGERSYSHLIAPNYVGRMPLGTNIDLTQEIRGTVVELQDDDSEVPIVNAIVKLYYRQNDMVVGRRLTAADGSFVFTDLLPIVGAYYAIAFYPGVGGTFPNARIYDRLTAQEP